MMTGTDHDIARATRMLEAATALLFARVAKMDLSKRLLRARVRAVLLLTALAACDEDIARKLWESRDFSSLVDDCIDAPTEEGALPRVNASKVITMLERDYREAVEQGLIDGDVS